MQIGFDAKRAFHNSTGLGNYSRTLIQSLAQFYPSHDYFLFNPKAGNMFKPTNQNLYEIRPRSILDKLIPSLWRSKTMVKDIEKYVQIYHGLSNELPLGIERSQVKKVVTIHDLIFEFFPDQYKKNDVLIYRKKFKYACQTADTIIAISESTKQDLIDVYNIPEDKIETCYQSCDPRFFTSSSLTHKNIIATKYQLQKPYFLSVGSIIERKNVLAICKAFRHVKRAHDIQLVIIGKGNGTYKQEVVSFIKQENLSADILFLEDHYVSEEIMSDLPTLYQSAVGFIYPSMKEGFGIPVLEGMASGTPVITSNQSSLREAGGPAAILINPNEFSQIEQAMLRLLTDEDFRNQHIQKGYQQAQLFSNEISCNQVMQVYKNLIPTL